jgi:signal transduction histidine kinase
MPPVTVGGFWAGQIRNRSFTDDDTVLTELASNIGQNAGHLRELHEVGRAVLNPQDLDGVRNSLREWAKALSQTITDAYRLQQTELSNDIQSQFRHCLSSGMERAQRRSKGGPSESVLARFVKPALRALQDSYHLEDVAIWRVDEKRLTLTQWCSSDGHDPAVIPISREIAIQATPGAPYVAASDSAPDSLTTFLLSELGKCDAAERTCIHVTETNRRGKYLILFQELAGSTWQIQGRAVQPAVAALLEGIGEAIATECDTLDRLEEEMTRNAALSERQEQTRKLCIRMAHLVSRPLLELKFAVKAFVSNPNLARLHMDACLTELARAVGVFQTFEFLTGDEKKGSKNGSSTSVIECLTSARETLLPLARLQRRTIEFYSHRRTEDCRVAVDTEPLLEIFENLLHNALKYSFGGRPVEVHVRLADPTNVEIQIINYGCGIGLNEFDKVFELEYRSPMGKRFVVEGSGIGLWVVRELTSLYEGEVRIVQSIEHDTYVVRKREVILYRTVLELRLPLAAT